MKLIPLFVAAALASTPVLAEDLCAVQLQKLDNYQAQIVTLGSPLQDQVEDLHKQAQEAQKTGDNDACIAHSAKALQLITHSKSDGQAPG